MMVGGILKKHVNHIDWLNNPGFHLVVIVVIFTYAMSRFLSNILPVF